MSAETARTAYGRNLHPPYNSVHCYLPTLTLMSDYDYGSDSSSDYDYGNDSSSDYDFIDYKVC